MGVVSLSWGWPSLDGLKVFVNVLPVVDDTVDFFIAEIDDNMYYLSYVAEEAVDP